MGEKLSQTLVQMAQNRAGRGIASRANQLNFEHEQQWKDQAFQWYSHWPTEKLQVLLSQLEHESRQKYSLAQEILINAWIAAIIEDLLAQPEADRIEKVG